MIEKNAHSLDPNVILTTEPNLIKSETYTLNTKLNVQYSERSRYRGVYCPEKSPPLLPFSSESLCFSPRSKVYPWLKYDQIQKTFKLSISLKNWTLIPGGSSGVRRSG